MFYILIYNHMRRKEKAYLGFLQDDDVVDMNTLCEITIKDFEASRRRSEQIKSVTREKVQKAA